MTNDTDNYDFEWIESAIDTINEWMANGFKRTTQVGKHDDTLLYKISETKDALMKARNNLVLLHCYPKGLTNEAFERFLSKESILIKTR